MDSTPDIDSVIEYLQGLQSNICDELNSVEPEQSFKFDSWLHKQGGGGITRVIQGGKYFEKGGVNFSQVKGDQLPASASTHRHTIAGLPFEATGVSL
ncbi:MAG: coproporphyrinogen III oxidase, partial [Gammaproteobacteria bacterium]|nr:coproporphyrinogen III oxidase [Gammaproteobacteria bacterium]